MSSEQAASILVWMFEEYETNVIDHYLYSPKGTISGRVYKREKVRSGLVLKSPFKEEDGLMDSFFVEEFVSKGVELPKEEGLYLFNVLVTIWEFPATMVNPSEYDVEVELLSFTKLELPKEIKLVRVYAPI